jgi:hypothetical protein
MIALVAPEICYVTSVALVCIGFAQVVGRSCQIYILQLSINSGITGDRVMRPLHDLAQRYTSVTTCYA